MPLVRAVASVRAVGNAGIQLCPLLKLLLFGLERKHILTAASAAYACLNFGTSHFMSLMLLHGVSAAVILWRWIVEIVSSSYFSAEKPSVKLTVQKAFTRAAF